MNITVFIPIYIGLAIISRTLSPYPPHIYQYAPTIHNYILYFIIMFFHIGNVTYCNVLMHRNIIDVNSFNFNCD